MSCNTEDYTVSFDEKVKGWTSFHSYYPDFMLGMNNKFFSFQGGNLHLHNSDTPDRNTYYGNSFPSKLSLMVNDRPSEIKELQAVSLEGNTPWDISLEAYVTDVEDAIRSSLKISEFVEKEGFWYAHARRSEDTHFNSRSTYGVGVVSNVTGNTVEVTGGNSALTVGDTLLKGDLTELGAIESYSTVQGVTTIVLTLTTNPVNIGDFVLASKNSRIEGANLRGYTMRMDLTLQTPTKAELFAVNSEVMKSFT